MTEPRYFYDNSLEGTATITHILKEGVILDSTLFHPQGGGQKGDCGFINAAEVTTTKRSPDGILHYTVDPEQFTIGQQVTLKVDATFRKHNTLLHSGGHLIAECLVRADSSIKPFKGQHWDGQARVECEFNQEQPPELEALRDQLGAEITRSVSAREPIVVQEIDGVRIVTVGEGRAVGCGGTHCADTGELEGIEIKKMRIKKGILAVSYHVPAPKN